MKPTKKNQTDVTRVETDRKDFLRALTRVERARRTTGVSMTVGTIAGITLRATDMVTYASDHVHAVPLAIAGPLALGAVDPTPLAKFLRSARGDVLTIEKHDSASDTERVDFSTDGGDHLALLLSTHPDELPAWPKCSKVTGGLEVGRDSLLDALRTVMPAVAREQGRYAFHGARLRVTSERAFLEGTDRHRMHLTEIQLGGRHHSIGRPDLLPDPSGIVPFGALKTLAAGLGKRSKHGNFDEGPRVVVLLSEGEAKYAQFRYGTFEVIAKCIDGEFLPTERIVEQPRAYRVDFDVTDALAALSVVRTVATNGAVLLDAAGGTLHMIGQSTEGEAKADVARPEDGTTDVGTSKKPAPAIGVNANYLEDALKVAKDLGGVWSLHWNTPHEPMELRHAFGFPTVRMLIMPIEFG